MFDTVGKAESLIGKVPPEEIRYYLPWGGITPVGQEILRDAAEAWEKREKTHGK